MDASYTRVGPTHFITGLLVLFLTTSNLAHADPVKVPFLFSEDEKLDQTEMRAAIPRSSDLQGDPYLNAPMTRLEYMLTQLEARINGEGSKDTIRSLLSDAFESRSPPSSISIDGFARSTRENGHTRNNWGQA